MSATTVNLTGELDSIEAGSTYRRVFTVVDELSGVPIDLTRFDPQVTAGAGGGRAYFRATVDSPGVPLLALGMVTDVDYAGVYIMQPASLGKVQILIHSDATELLSYDTDALVDAPKSIRGGVWDCELVGIGTVGLVVQEVLRIFEGAWLMSAESTRAQV